MPQHTILLADDEPHITHVVSHKLRAAGLGVVVTSDGEEALEAATLSPPSLVVTDLQMPHLSGIELATRLRAQASTRDVPVILLTARGYFVEPAQMAETNIQEVMAKPFTARGLLERVLDLLNAPTSRRGAA